MNKLLTTIVGAALGLTMTVGVGVAVANNREAVKAEAATGLTQTISYSNFSGGTQGSGSSITSTSTGVISVNLSKGYKNSTYTHNYANGVITISGDSTVSKISQVVITASGTSYTGAQSNGSYTVTSGGGTISVNNTTITYSGGTGTSAVFSHNKQLRFTEMVVTYDTTSGGSTETKYTVSFDANMYEYTDAVPDATQASEGASVTLPSLTYPDYSFIGWNTSSSGGQSTRVASPYTPAADITLYGEWSETIPSGAQAYHLKDMSGFSTWGSSYSAHSHSYTTGNDTVTVELASANKSTATITNVPVTKGGNVELKLTSSNHYIKDVIFVAKQWSNKAQTMTLHTSSNGGDSYTSTGTTSTNFRIQNSSSFADGTNAVKISFSSTSDQVGLVKFYVTFGELTNHYTVSSGTSGLTVSPLNITATGGDVTLTTASKKKATSISATNATISATNGNVITLSNVTGNVVVTGTVVDADITSIEVKNPTTTFSLSDDFVFGGTVEATYDDFVSPHTTETLDSSDYTVDSENAFRKGVEGVYTIRVTCGSVYDEYDVTVADVTYYSLVEDADDLVDGAEIILVTNKTTASVSNRYAMTKTISSSLNGFAQVTVSNDEIYRTATTQGYAYTLIEDAEGWSLYNSSTEKYLVSETNKKMLESATATSNWDVTISNGVATLVSSYASSVGHIMFNWNNGSARFTTYTGEESATMVLPSIYQYAPAPKTISDTRLTTSGGSITANVGADGWSVSGFVFEVQYEGESTWNEVHPTYTVTESVPTSYDSVGEYPVHFKVTYKGVDYNANTSFTATVIDDMTPISSFFDGTETITSTASSKVYTYRGTVIAIEGNTYYLQQGEYGIMVYGGSTAPATGMKVGDLVSVTSKIINYNNYVVESNSITTVDGKTCKILGTGTLPTAPIVTTVAAFEAKPQSTRVTFNGLSRNDEGTSITWKNTWTQGSSHGVAQVKDSTGATTFLYVSKFLDSSTGSAIVSKINEIGEDDTFDVFQGVMAVNTNNSGTFHSAGTKHLSITSANQITIHAADADPILDWIDAYLYMDDESFEGNGTGLCNSQHYYVNAKAGLAALEAAHSGSIAAFQADANGDYTAALARYSAWAVACNDGAPFDGNSTIVTPLRTAGIQPIVVESTNVIPMVIIISMISLTTVGGYFFLKKKKEQQLIKFNNRNP